MGDANAISAQNVVGGNLEILHGNKEVVHGTKITTDNYTVNNVTNEAGFAQNSVNVEELLKKAKSYYNDGNYFKALGILREISDKDVEALYYIGLCTRDGNGTKQDSQEAERLLKEASSAGFPAAQSSLACMYMSDNYGLKNVESAISLFKKAIEGGDSVALANLGEIYLCGYNVEKDENLALSLLKQIKEDKSTATVLFALGNIYFNGSVVEQNIRQSLKYYQKAEELLSGAEGLLDYEKEICVAGLINYAKIYIENLDGVGDYEQGEKLLQLAIDEFESSDAAHYLESRAKKAQFRTITFSNIFGASVKKVIDSFGVQFSLDKTKLEGCDDDYWDDSIEEYVVPDTVKVIELAAFKGKSLKRIILPENLEKIESGAFEECRHLESIVIPNKVKVIERDAFNGCSNLKSVSFGTSVESIEGAVFRDCRSLKEVRIPESVIKLDEFAFDSDAESAPFKIYVPKRLYASLISSADEWTINHQFKKYVPYGKASDLGDNKRSQEKPTQNRSSNIQSTAKYAEEKASTTDKIVSSLFGMFRKK